MMSRRRTGILALLVVLVVVAVTTRNTHACRFANSANNNNEDYHRRLASSPHHRLFTHHDRRRAEEEAANLTSTNATESVVDAPEEDDDLALDEVDEINDEEEEIEEVAEEEVIEETAEEEVVEEEEEMETEETATENEACVASPELEGLQVELRMMSRQTRGLITVLNNCRFEVSRLEVALSPHEETIDLEWHWAESLEVVDVLVKRYTLANGGTHAAANLTGDATYTFDVEPSVDLESQVGAILLYEKGGDRVLGQALIQKLKPGPAADLLASQPTYFDNCLSLSDNSRLRWTVVTDGNPDDEEDTASYLEVGLEYVVPYGDATNTWMAFGPGSPGVQDRLMGGSDVIMSGFRKVDDAPDTEEEMGPLAFAEDYYIGGYEVCTDISDDISSSSVDRNSNVTYDGVCRDSIWTRGMTSTVTSDVDGSVVVVENKQLNDEGDMIQQDNDVELLYSQVLEGVAFLRVRRPLLASTPVYDHDILLGESQHFVWARGPLDPTQGIAEVQFHGYQFGQLKGMNLNATTWQCPPLKGIELEVDDEDSELAEGDDAFAQQFEHSSMLQGDVVEVFWTLMPETSQIRIGGRANKGISNWMSIAVGSSMTDSWAWVATAGSGDDGNDPQLFAYRMSGLDATTVRLLEDQSPMISAADGDETAPVVSDDGGTLSFSVVAQWPLPGMKEGETTAPLIWAVGPSWRRPSADGSQNTSPKREDEHSIRSKAPTTIDFATGGAQVGEGISNAVLLAHGAVMWIAWLVGAPFVGIASRFVRDDPCLKDTNAPLWITLHKNAAFGVTLLSILGLILSLAAVADAGLQHIVSSHAKMGIALLAIVAVQNSLGMVRPSPGDGMKRKLWEISHRVFALTMLALAIAATITGSQRLEDFDSTTRHGVALTVAWIIVVVVLMGIYEVRKRNIAAFEAAAVPTNEPGKLEEGGEDVAEQAKQQQEPVAKSSSPWISTYWMVYTVPYWFGMMLLVLIAVVAFTGSTSLETEMTTTSSAVASSSAIETATAETTTIPPTAATEVTTTAEVTEVTTTATEPAAAPVTSTSTPIVPVEISEDCMAFPREHVGDGWCDDHEPFNTAECGWDGGDCCNIDNGLYNCKDPSSPNFGKASPTGWEAPLTIPRNPRYSVSREESLESWVTSYNNYYEFGFSKDIVDEANHHAEFLAPETWYLDISGLVENPMTIDVPSLVNSVQLEERMYRHRCVEAWSITAPWIGFPLSKLLDMVKPKPEAGIVQFKSWEDHSVSSTQATSSYYAWPYQEALTITEARNELTMLTVGAFGKPLTPQQGAPIRLTVPWKYGFKSIKSIQQITFLEDNGSGSTSRETFWNVANGREYGFYANVNPEVPHPRWSQATERHYVQGFPGVRLDSTRMNGYQALVDYMYEGDLENREIYF